LQECSADDSCYDRVEYESVALANLGTAELNGLYYSDQRGAQRSVEGGAVSPLVPTEQVHEGVVLRAP